MTRARPWPLTLAMVLAILAALPVAVTPIPLMADLPNHIARHQLMADSLFGSASADWAIAWRWVGNLGVDLPAVMLTPLLGAELATRLVVLAIAPLTVLGLLALGRAVYGRLTPGVALALPFAFAQPWHYGFVNSCLSVALALFVAAAWIKRPTHGPTRAFGFAAAALAVWTAHIMGWGVLLLLVAGAELAGVRGWRDLVRRMVRAAPLLAPLIPLLAWRGAALGPAFVFAANPLNEKVVGLATVLKGLWLPLDLAMLGAIGLLAMLALFLAWSPRIEPRLTIGAMLLIVAFLAMPTTLLGSWGADLRLAPVAVMIALTAIVPTRDRRVGRLLIVVGLGLFAVRALATTALWLHAQPALAARLAVIEAVPDNARLAYVEATPSCDTPWTLSPVNKLAAYAVPRKGAFVNTLFHIPGSDPIIRSPANARWFDGSQTLPCADDQAGLDARLSDFTAAGFDAIWVADPPAGLLPPPGYRPARRTAQDTLFVRDGL